MEWNDIRHFLALARSGSVRAAGATLGVSHSTVARRVEALEEQLQARLFDRNRDGYVLTAAGELMVPGAERVEQEMAALERGVAGRDERLSGVVTVTCCDAFVSDLVLADLTPFCTSHPEIALSIVTDSRPFDLNKREADIAIRTLPKGAQPPEFLIGQRLAPVVIANYVALAHATKLDPENPANTPRWLCSNTGKYQDALIAASSYPDVPGWGTFSSIDLMLQGARHGLGIVMLPTYVGDGDSALRRLEQPDLRHLADLWLLSHPDLRDNARFRATRQCITAMFKRRAALFGAVPLAD